MPGLNELIEATPRVRVLRDGPVRHDGQSVLYWMQRSQRGRDNLAIDLAIDLGKQLDLPVLAAFGLTANYPAAQRRHYRFLVDGLPEIARDLQRRKVPLVVRLGEPDQIIVALARESRAAIVVGDENPVRVGQHWREQAAKHLTVPFTCVDSDVVVPTSLFPKEEFAARTIRPKIHRVWNEYLKPSANSASSVPWKGPAPPGEPLDPDHLLKSLRVGGVPEVRGYRGGPDEAARRLERFVRERLSGYATRRNEPSPYHTTELSAHLHYGHISPITIALAAKESDAPQEDVDSLLEELIVRRELAINYVARNPEYDRLSGSPRWALETLEKHRKDKRPFLYTLEQLDAADTHDPYWNASQKEMVLSGRMHNYMRMYWAKKILEWTPDAATAFAIAVELNDRYEMDGRDPNGYAGVAWAVSGKHDRPWPERPIFGTVRTMTAGGLEKKIDTRAYLEYVTSLER